MSIWLCPDDVSTCLCCARMVSEQCVTRWRLKNKTKKKRITSLPTQMVADVCSSNLPDPAMVPWKMTCLSDTLDIYFISRSLSDANKSTTLTLLPSIRHFRTVCLLILLKTFPSVLLVPLFSDLYLRTPTKSKASLQRENASIKFPVEFDWQLWGKSGCPSWKVHTVEVLLLSPSVSGKTMLAFYYEKKCEQTALLFLWDIGNACPCTDSKGKSCLWALCLWGGE